MAHFKRSFLDSLNSNNEDFKDVDEDDESLPIKQELIVKPDTSKYVIIEFIKNFGEVEGKHGKRVNFDSGAFFMPYEIASKFVEKGYAQLR